MVNPNHGHDAGGTDEETMNTVLDCYARSRLQSSQFDVVKHEEGFSAEALSVSIALLAAERVIDSSSFGQLYNEVERLIGGATVHGIFLAQKSRQFEAEE